MIKVGVLSLFLKQSRKWGKMIEFSVRQYSLSEKGWTRLCKFQLSRPLCDFGQKWLSLTLCSPENGSFCLTRFCRLHEMYSNGLVCVWYVDSHNKYYFPHCFLILSQIEYVSLILTLGQALRSHNSTKVIFPKL